MKQIFQLPSFSILSLVAMSSHLPILKLEYQKTEWDPNHHFKDTLAWQEIKYAFQIPRDNTRKVIQWNDTYETERVLVNISLMDREKLVETKRYVLHRYKLNEEQRHRLLRFCYCIYCTRSKSVFHRCTKGFFLRHIDRRDCMINAFPTQTAITEAIAAECVYYNFHVV